MKIISFVKGYKFPLLFVGSLLFSSFFHNANSQTTRTLLKWSDPIKESLIYPDVLKSTDNQLPFFEEAVFKSEYGKLPVYTGIIPAPANSGNNTWTIELKNPIFEKIPSDQVRNFSEKKFSSSIEIVANEQISRKIRYISFEFVPIIRNKNTGELERLVSFIPTPKIASVPNKNIKSGSSTRNYSNQSVLASGEWYKIRVSESGIHMISYDDIAALGISNPANIRIFGNGGEQLPFDSSLPKTDDLVENPIYMNKGSDGDFNSGDYILFYAKGPVSWSYDKSDKMFIHNLNQYSDYAYYFLTVDVGSGKKISDGQKINQAADFQVNSFDDYQFREKDSINLIKSGRLWCWSHFSLDLDHSYSFQFPGWISGTPVKMISNNLSRSTSASNNSKFHLIVDDKIVNSIEMPGVNTSNYEALFASQKRIQSVFTPEGNEWRVDIRYERHNPAGEGWLDYLVLNTRSRLKYQGKQFNFRDIESVEDASISKFVIESGGYSIQVWDVTDIENAKSMPLDFNGQTASFTANSDVLKEYVVFDPSSGDFPKPEMNEDGLGLIENQNLHGVDSPDMIIIVHDNLLAHAQDLAQFHKEDSGLESLIVSPDKIYNEFSSGALDASAIRDFIKMFYDRSGPNMKLKYLLLFGDGSYDNKNINKEYPTCIPTFQSAESMYPTSSYVTDDYFGLLDDGENLEPGLLDIGIGRFPVVSGTHAAIMVDKIKHYKDQITFGDWRNLICFIGDDEDGNGHMEDANTLAEKVNMYYPYFNVDKVFLDAYQQITMPAGDRYPEVNRVINDRIKKGALIMNYLGHGSERGLAHEDILTTPDIQSWDNYDKLPLFITATCEFSRFDDHELTSAGEWVLLNPNGGGIGLYTTTRLVYSSPNFRLNKVLYDFIFKRKADGARYRFGDVMRLTKNAVGPELNKLNFTLLSDPALTLNFPENNIIMTGINEQPVAEFSDTLKALSHATVSGFVADRTGNKLEGFNGVVTPSVFDKEVVLTNLANDGGPIMEFTVQDNILFRGKVSVKDGDFKFSFIVPKDIAYNIGQGRFSFYATDGVTDANGVNSSVLIGGSADSVFADNEGPDVRLFMNDTSFVFGGLTNENPIFLASLSDQYGINTTGNGIGHDITAIIDGNKQSTLVLNDYYESDLDNYKAGTIRYPLQDLESGVHTMQLKVWDILNNSSEKEIKFEVIGSERMEIKNILNYPNPFTTHTEFYFEHNQAYEMLDVQIQVFTVSGRLVKTFSFLNAENTQLDNNSFRVGPIVWDGLDDFGDRIGRGTYIYRVRIRNQDGRTKEGFQKLVILR